MTEDGQIEQYDKFLARQIAGRINEITHRQSSELRFKGWDYKTCWDCSDPIPAERLALHRVRCLACQELADLDGVD